MHKWRHRCGCATHILCLLHCSCNSCHRWLRLFVFCWDDKKLLLEFFQFMIHTSSKHNMSLFLSFQSSPCTAWLRKPSASHSLTQQTAESAEHSSRSSMMDTERWTPATNRTSTVGRSRSAFECGEVRDVPSSVERGGELSRRECLIAKRRLSN